MPQTYTRECVGCNNTFDTLNARQKRCRNNCGQQQAARPDRRPARQFKNPTRNAIRVEHTIEFVGVDGEGDPTQPNHPYVLLSVGDKSIDNGGNALTFEQIMSFLWDCFQENPNAAYVGYFLGYDFTHWLRSLPEDRARMLLTKIGKASRERKLSGGNHVPFPVGYGDWEFDLLGTKRFKLRKKGAQSWMYVCDVGPFFQKSFVKAIDPSAWTTPVCTADQYATIVKGKADRSSAALGSDMIRYNVTENLVLASLMERLNKGFVNGANVRLARNKWFGPGQAAQAWMKTIDAPTTEALNQVIPQAVKDAGRASYYGGWFEIFAHGPIPGESHEYDINSAYPFIIAELPCLLHGRWVHQTGRHTTPNLQYLCLMYAIVTSPKHLSGQVRVGTMPHRTPKGNIMRPSQSEGWYWRHELEAARRAGTIETVDVKETYWYDPCACLPPYRGIRDLYMRRLEAGKNGPEGVALKLLYNSAYGKMAQSIGNPQFSCSIYASLITAGCRTQILDAIASHPTGVEDLLMVATDGVYFRTPHPTLDLDKQRLGAWDHTIKTNLSLFMPGVYWDDNTRAGIKAGNAPILKSRGVPAAALAGQVERADFLWVLWQCGADFFPFVELPLPFVMTTATLALARNKWDTCGAAKTDVKTISANPRSKRDVDSVYYDKERHYGRSYAYGPQTPLASIPYDKQFGAEDLQDLETPDGSVNALIAEALGS